MRVPTYQRQVDFPVQQLPEVDPRTMTQDITAAGNLFATASDAASKELGRIQYAKSKLQDERDAIDVTNALSKFSDEEREYLTATNTTPVRGMYENASKWYDETTKRYSEGFKSDIQRSAFAKLILSRRDTGLDGVAKAEAKFHTDQKEAAFSTRFDSALKDAALFADDDARMNGILNELFGGDGVPGWFDVLHPKASDAAEKSKLKGEFLSSVVGQLMLSDPEKADRYLEKYKADLGKSWLPLKKNVEQARFKKDLSLDPHVALARLEKGDYVLDPLTEQNNRALAVGKIEKLEQDQEKALKKEREEAEQQVMDLIEQKDYVGASGLLDSYEQKRMLSPETRRTLRNLINNPVAEKSDPDEYHAMEMKVLLGTAGQTQILKSKLTIPDKNKLLKILKDDKDSRKSYDYVSAMDSAKAQIITTGLMAALDPDQQSRFTAYKRAAEKNALSGGDAWEFFDANIWKYMPGIPPTKYGTPKTLDDVTVYESQLRNDVATGKIKTPVANLEAAKLKMAKEVLPKTTKAKNNVK